VVAKEKELDGQDLKRMLEGDMCYNVYGRALPACENQNCGGAL
jgi:hypothetical protein